MVHGAKEARCLPYQDWLNHRIDSDQWVQTVNYYIQAKYYIFTLVGLFSPQTKGRSLECLHWV